MVLEKEKVFGLIVEVEEEKKRSELMLNYYSKDRFLKGMVKKMDAFESATCYKSYGLKGVVGAEVERLDKVIQEMTENQELFYI